MMRLGVVMTSEIKDRFFDRAAIIAILGREDARRLSKMGAYVRRRARTDILRRAPKRKNRNGRRASAAPGRPPLVHSNDSFANLRNILFGLSDDNNAVVIGPRFVPSMRLERSSAKTVPELLEKGGSAVVEQWSNDGDTWQFGSSRAAEYHRMVSARYHPHPFMGPALQKEIDAGVVANVWSAGAS
jgi:hypothetical protein